MNRITESLKLEETSGDDPVPLVHLVPEQGFQDHAPSGFEHLQGWALRSFSRQPMLMLSHPHSKRFFLYLSGMSCVSVCAHSLLSCNWAPLRRLWLHLLYLPSISYVCAWIRPPKPSLLQSERPHHSQIFQSFNHLCDPCSAHTSKSMSLFLCLSCAEESRAGPTTPDVFHQCWAMLCLIQPRRLLTFFAARAHCWVMFN